MSAIIEPTTAIVAEWSLIRDVLTWARILGNPSTNASAAGSFLMLLGGDGIDTQIEDIAGVEMQDLNDIL